MSAWGAALGAWKRQTRGYHGRWVKSGATAGRKAASNTTDYLGNHKLLATSAALGVASIALGNKRTRTRVTGRSAMHSRGYSLKVPKLGTLSATGTVTFKRNQTPVEKAVRKTARDTAYGLSKKGTAGKVAGALLDNSLGYGTVGKKNGLAKVKASKRNSTLYSSKATSTGRAGKRAATGATSANPGGKTKRSISKSPTGNAAYGARPQRRKKAAKRKKRK